MANEKSNKPNTIKKETAELERTKKAKARVLVALERSLGIVTSACKAAQVGRTQFYEWLSTDQEFKAAVDDIAEVALDFAESQLLAQIKAGEVSSTIFYLKTKGKKRGFVEKTEMQHDFGNEIGGFEISIKRNRD